MVPGLVVPFVAAALAQAGASAGLYSERFALSVMVVVVAALIQAMILGAVRAVREHDDARARLERENLQNIQRYATLTREAPVGIFETDAEGRPTFVNEDWVGLAGISAQDAYAGRSAIHPDDRDRVRAEWRDASEAGRSYDAEFRFLRPDGEVRWVATRGTALRDVQGDVTGYMGSVLDITDRRAAERRTELVVSRIAEARQRGRLGWTAPARQRRGPGDPRRSARPGRRGLVDGAWAGSSSTSRASPSRTTRCRPRSRARPASRSTIACSDSVARAANDAGCASPPAACPRKGRRSRS